MTVRALPTLRVAATTLLLLALPWPAAAGSGPHETILVSRASGADGDKGNGESGETGFTRAAVSADGSSVAFPSEATNLHPEDSDEITDVFVRDVQGAQSPPPSGGCPSDWVWEHPVPTANSLSAVSFLDEETAVAVGSAGTVYRTTNGGLSWVALRCGADGLDPFDRTELLGVHYIDSGNIIAVGTSWHDGSQPYGLVTKSTDGGATWTSQIEEPGFVLTGVYFGDSDSGIVIGTDASTVSPVILKTTDGGQTWDRVTSGVPAVGLLEGLSFSDSTTGTTVGLGPGSALILRTTDGGANWTQQTTDTAVALMDVSFLDTNNGWAVGGPPSLDASPPVFRTTNGGQDWTTHDTGADAGLFLNGVSFVDPLNGFIVGDDDILLETSDGGITWTPAVLPSERSGLEAVSFTGMTGLIVGRQGAILSTTDGGSSWANRRHSIVPFNDRGEPGRLDAVDFVDTSTGIVVGGTLAWVPSGTISATPEGVTTGPKGTILKTTDGGRTWAEKESGTDNHLRGASWGDTQFTIAVGGIADPSYPDAVILASTDAGETWAPQQMPETSRPWTGLSDVYCIDSWACTAVGDNSDGGAVNGLIIRTEDGGSTWTVVVDEFGLGHVNGVSFADASIGAAVTSLGKILRTTDGGGSWTLQTSTIPLRDVFFIGSTGWAVGGEIGDGTILKTEDAGGTWIVVEDGLPERLNSVYFSDVVTGTVVGADGRIFRTTDGGESWTPDPSGTSNGLLGVARIAEGTEVAVGQYGTILRRLGETAELAVVPNPIDFGSVAVGESDGKSLILTSIGTEDVTIDDVSTPDAPFAAAGGTCDASPFTLSPGESCALDFVFSPTEKGPVETAVTVAGNAAGGPRTVILRGTGISSLSVSPDPLNFGEVHVGETGGPQSVTLTNISAVDMEVGDVSDPGVPFVMVGGSCGVAPFTLAPDTSCTIDYTFSPTTEGPAGVTVTIANDAPSSPDTFTLEGDGLPPRAIVTAAPESFDVTLEAGQTATESLIVGNLGGATLTWSIDTAEPPAAGRPQAGGRIADGREIVDIHTASASDLTSLLGSPLPGVRPINAVAGVVDCDAEPGLLVHDDGTVENGYSGNPAVVSQVIFVDRFTPSAYPALFRAVCVAFLTQGPTSLDFEIVAFDDDGPDGGPGTELGALLVSASGLPGTSGVPAWHSYDISSLDLVIDSGSVYIGVRYAPSNPNVFVSADQSPGNPVGFAGGYWWNENSDAWMAIESSFEDYRSLFVRAAEISAGCQDPTILPWLHIDPNAGNTPPGGSTPVTVTVDTAGLAVGVYTANLCISSNDPVHPLVGVPVNLTVLGSELAFDPPSLDFGDVLVGTTSPPQAVTLQNTGNLDATGLNFQILGDGFDADTDACGTTLPVGGQCQISVTFSPSETGPAEATLEVTSDQDAFASLGLAGNGVGDGGFTATTLEVDPFEFTSDGNGVFEPGESVDVAPAWRNDGPSSQSLAGTASNLTGPDGGDYTVVLDDADYGTLDPGQTASCLKTGVCYQVSVDDPAVRPAPHWEATFDETLDDTDGASKTWTVHIGDSFVDVPPTNLFYPSVETLLHHGVTGGCTDTEYCPTASNTRDQMPVFVLRAVEGADYEPPACIEGAEVFHDVAAGNVFCSWIEELANRGVVSGCGGDNYCPNAPVTRAQMTVFLLRTLEGSDYEPPACTGQFVDVPCPSLFADWIEDLFAREITGGCGSEPLRYCPANPVNREQMAAFVSKAFGLMLYGP